MVVVGGMETGLGPGASVRIHARVSAKYNINFVIIAILLYQNHAAYQVQYLYLQVIFAYVNTSDSIIANLKAMAIASVFQMTLCFE